MKGEKKGDMRFQSTLPIKSKGRIVYTVDYSTTTHKTCFKQHTEHKHKIQTTNGLLSFPIEYKNV